MTARRTPPIVFAGRLGLLSFALLVAGPLLVRVGGVEPTVALMISSFSGISSALAAGMLAFSMAKGLRPGDKLGWLGGGLAILCTVVTTAWAAAAARYDGADDVTTNADAPPRLEGVEDGRSIHFEGLASVPLALDPDDAFAAVERTAKKMPWRITVRDNATRHLEATTRSTIFRFEDRIAIDVRTDTASTAVVEMRAKSEQKARDLGRNIGHIQDFTAKLEAEP